MPLSDNAPLSYRASARARFPAAYSRAARAAETLAAAVDMPAVSIPSVSRVRSTSPAMTRSPSETRTDVTAAGTATDRTASSAPSSRHGTTIVLVMSPGSTTAIITGTGSGS